MMSCRRAAATVSDSPRNVRRVRLRVVGLSDDADSLRHGRTVLRWPITRPRPDMRDAGDDGHGRRRSDLPASEQAGRAVAIAHPATRVISRRRSVRTCRSSRRGSGRARPDPDRGRSTRHRHKRRSDPGPRRRSSASRQTLALRQPQ